MRNLIALSEEIWKLLDIDWFELPLEEQNKLNATFEDTIKLLMEKIQEKEIDIFELGFIKEKDLESHSMPVDVMFKVYQKIIYLGYDTEENLKAFANYLSFYAPDWEEEVDNILKYLDEGNVKKAKEVALSVDYDKFN